MPDLEQNPSTNYADSPQKKRKKYVYSRLDALEFRQTKHPKRVKTVTTISDNDITRIQTITSPAENTSEENEIFSHKTNADKVILGKIRYGQEITETWFVYKNNPEYVFTSCYGLKKVNRPVIAMNKNELRLKRNVTKKLLCFLSLSKEKKLIYLSKVQKSLVYTCTPNSVVSGYISRFGIEDND